MTDHVIFSGANIVREDITAAGAITPGHLVDPAAGVVHGTGDANALVCFADVDPWRESAAGVKQIDTAYASGQNVHVGYPQRGEKVYALLATSQTIAAGDALASAGDGTLQAVSVLAATSQALRDGIVAYAAEAVTTTTAVARIWVRAN